MPTVTEPVVKPGWQTTEFWTKMVPQVLGIFVLMGWVDADAANNMSGGFSDILSGIMIMVPELSYCISRTMVKKNAPVQTFDREPYVRDFWRRKRRRESENKTKAN